MNVDVVVTESETQHDVIYIQTVTLMHLVSECLCHVTKAAQKHIYHSNIHYIQL